MIEITQEDNMQLMARYPDNHFELAIVDPPYGINVTQMNMGSRKRSGDDKDKKWDKEVPTQEYFNELKRVSKNYIIWGGNYFDLGVCGKFIIWDKEIPLGLSFSDCEYAHTSFNGANKIFRYSAYKDKKSKFHPTQKPVKLYEWLLMNYAKEGDKILDTHLGSGSIAIACHNLGFDLTACELDKDYYNAAIKRLQQHQSQIRIF